MLDLLLFFCSPGTGLGTCVQPLQGRESSGGRGAKTHGPAHLWDVQQSRTWSHRGTEDTDVNI